MAKIRTERIALVGELITRHPSTARVGQVYTDCMFLKYREPGTGKVAARVYPRPEFSNASFVASVVLYVIHAWEGSGLSGSNELVYGVANGANTTIYRHTNSLGDITGACTGVEETFINSGTTPVVTFTSADNTGWYYPLDSGTGTKTFVGDLNIGVATITNIASTTGIYSGQAITGTGIPAGTRVLTVDSATQITMTANSTATNAGVTVTREKIAKIIDADFPGNAGYTLAGTFVAMDQRLSVMTTDSYVWSSNTDSVTAWGAATKVPSVESPDGGRGLIRAGSILAAFGSGSLEFFQNAGLESGSPFVTMKNEHSKIGLVSARAMVRARNTVYWIGGGKEAPTGVFELSGRTPKRISDGAIEAFLANTGANLAGLYLSYAVLEGIEFLLIGIEGSSTVMPYQFDVGLWGKWSVTGAGAGIKQCANTNADGQYMCYAIGADTTANARIGKMFPNSTDNAVAAGFSIRLEPMAFGTMRGKKMHEMRVYCERSTVGTASVRFSDNDNISQKSARTVNLAAAVPTLRRCGRFRKRGIEIYGGISNRVGFDAIEVDIEDLK